MLPLLVTLLVVALVVAIVALALQDDPQSIDAVGGGDTPSESESSSPTDPDSPSESASPEPPTRAELRDYIESYLQTASTDPAAGFEQLTAPFQRESTRYEEFWGSVSNPVVLRFSADPEALTVSYTYRYQREGVGRQVDDVRLQLVRRGDELLIDGPI